MTILGSGEAVCEAVLSAARVAVARIDLRTHIGVHPRIGAIDVVPVVPIRVTSLEQARGVAEIIGAIPAASLGGQSPEAIRWHTYNPSQIIETWLTRA
jgi:glutamate formiminotransferase